MTVCRQNVKRYLTRTLEGTTLAILYRLYLLELPLENNPEATKSLEPVNAMASNRPSVTTSAGWGPKTVGPASNLAFFATEVCLDVASCGDVA